MVNSNPRTGSKAASTKLMIPNEGLVPVGYPESYAPAEKAGHSAIQSSLMDSFRISGSVRRTAVFCALRFHAFHAIRAEKRRIVGI